MRLVVQNLACTRGGRHVFDGVNFSLGSGQLMQLVGPNGAGKSSLLRLIGGLAESDDGKIHIEDDTPSELSVGQRTHLIGHQDALKPALTVQENLAFWGDYLGGGDVDKALRAFALQPLANYPAQYLSAGQKRRLSLSRLALIPRVLWLLDEPTVGLDTGSIERLRDLIVQHLAAGGMAIAATHVPLPVGAHTKYELGSARVAA